MIGFLEVGAKGEAEWGEHNPKAICQSFCPQILVGGMHYVRAAPLARWFVEFGGNYSFTLRPG
jgi:hypothetical protein